jgi:hypothetical protein
MAQGSAVRPTGHDLIDQAGSAGLNGAVDPVQVIRVPEWVDV